MRPARWRRAEREATAFVAEAVSGSTNAAFGNLTPSVPHSVDGEGEGLVGAWPDEFGTFGLDEAMVPSLWPSPRGRGKFRACVKSRQKPSSSRGAW
jgi:hypothetical protein